MRAHLYVVREGRGKETRKGAEDKGRAHVGWWRRGERAIEISAKACQALQIVEAVVIAEGVLQKNGGHFSNGRADIGISEFEPSFSYEVFRVLRNSQGSTNITELGPIR